MARGATDGATRPHRFALFLTLYPPSTNKVAVTAGAILAGASEEEIKACETYALDVGLAFQVTCVL